MTPARPSAFARLGRFTVRYRWPVLVGYLVTLAVVGVLGAGVFGSLKSEGFLDPGSQSAEAATALEEEFGVRAPVVALIVQLPQGVDEPASLAAAQTLTTDLESMPGVDLVQSYWSLGKLPSLKGADGRTAQVIVYANQEANQREVAAAIDERFAGESAGITIWAYGGPLIGKAFNDTITADIAKAESVAIPLTLILLLFVFGSVVSAGLPFLVAGASILGSFLVIYLVGQVTDVSIFALNLVTGLGLALGIDYALLAINRFREELAAGAKVEDAVITTVATAGKTVFVSGITVAVTLASMVLFPQYFLKSFAYAGASVSLLAVLGSLTALPAMLAILGPRVNRLRVRRGNLAPKDDGTWARVARFVMRRPWPVLIVVVAGLLAVASPALGAVFGLVDDRALPADHPVSVAGSVLREQFPGYDSSPYALILQSPGTATEIAEYANSISMLPNVASVTTPESVVVDGAVIAANPEPATYTADGAVRMTVISEVSPLDADGAELVQSLRSTAAPAEQLLVGGVAAAFVDATAGIANQAWIVALWIAIATLVILFLYTGSVLLPIKAVLLNVLSLAATLGALVWVFQGHHLTWLTGDYVDTGRVDISTVALIAVTAFALSMDYELFLLSRIKEEHDAGLSTTDAVALGLQRTGRIITAAALLIAVVFAAFLSSGTTNIKQLGFGVTFAILVDATIVRGLLVPAFMRIAGRWNWWAPAPLQRLHARIGLRDS